MNDINKSILFGCLGDEPEIRYTPGGQSVANFHMATNESWTEKNGDKTDKVEWHKVVCWGKLAESLSLLKKGERVFVEGKMQTRKWKDKDDKTRYTTEINATNVTFVK